MFRNDNVGASVVLAQLVIGDWFTAAVAGAGAVAVALPRWRIAPPLLVGIAAPAGLVAFRWLRPAWLVIRR